MDGFLQKQKRYLEVVKDNIGYDDYVLYGRGYIETEELDEIVGIIVRAICSEKPTENICGQEFPREVVRSAMLKVDMTCIENALENMKQTENIRNHEKYLLSTLFNEANGRHFKENSEERWADYAVKRDFGY